MKNLVLKGKEFLSTFLTSAVGSFLKVTLAIVSFTTLAYAGALGISKAMAMVMLAFGVTYLTGLWAAIYITFYLYFCVRLYYWVASLGIIQAYFGWLSNTDSRSRVYRYA